MVEKIAMVKILRLFIAMFPASDDRTKKSTWKKNPFRQFRNYTKIRAFLKEKIRKDIKNIFGQSHKVRV